MGENKTLPIFGEIDKTLNEHGTTLPPGGLAEAAQKAGTEVTVTDVHLTPADEEDPTRAIVNVAPGTDPEVIKLEGEIQKILTCAKNRTVASVADVEEATNDLSIMSNLKKSVEGYRKAYLQPIRDADKIVNAVFKLISEPLTEADKITRGKVLTFREHQEKLRVEAEEAARLQREADEAARKVREATGEKVPEQEEARVVVPDKTTGRMSAGLGTSGLVDNWKWEVEDFSILPDKYKEPNAPLIGKIIRAGGEIPGIKAWKEKGLRVTARGGQ